MKTKIVENTTTATNNGYYGLDKVLELRIFFKEL